jgi:hypothetical protein
MYTIVIPIQTNKRKHHINERNYETHQRLGQKEPGIDFPSGINSPLPRAKECCTSAGTKNDQIKRVILIRMGST